jgi:hypothetical protein
MVSCASRIIYLRSPLTSYTCPHSRIWSLPSGQCLKTLAEGHNAIWYEGVSLVPPFAHTTHALPSNLANTYSSPQIRNTYSLLPTTAPYVCGTSRRRAVSRHTSATKIQSTASPPASASRAASGLCRGAKTVRSTCGTCRAERSCRYSMVITVSTFPLPPAIAIC